MAKVQAKENAKQKKLAAEIARGVADRTVASDWDDPLVTDGRTELEAAWRRSNGRCGICGRLVSLSRRHMDPLEATIDHRIPQSRGGGDERANLQIAHRRCNNRKGNR
jgi:5-methylcytosine-specific restriction endonuclease McrA